MVKTRGNQYIENKKVERCSLKAIVCLHTSCALFMHCVVGKPRDSVSSSQEFHDTQVGVHLIVCTEITENMGCFGLLPLV